MSLEREMIAYRRLLPELLAGGKQGKYALIKGENLLGTFESLDAALGAGYEHGLNELFLVKEIVAQEQPRYFSRNITSCPS